MFGSYGGAFVPESLNYAIHELEKAYICFYNDVAFAKTIRDELVNYSGRPTPVYYARKWSKILGGAMLLLKREDLGSTGSHKINNVIGQILVAKRMSKVRIVAETGAGQHGVAVSTFAAKLNLRCVIYMGKTDVERQEANVRRMKLLGAKVEVVSIGSSGLKEALSEAIRDWVTNVSGTFYVLGTAAGPFPYPSVVRCFQRLIGEESQVQVTAAMLGQPRVVVASVGGGSNAIGVFYPYVNSSVRLVGVEAAGSVLEEKKSAASVCLGLPGVLHGSYTFVLQSEEGQINRTHSISAGLDYPGIGPEHPFLSNTKKVKYVPVGDESAIATFIQCARVEGIVPALESCHAISYGTKIAPSLDCDVVMLVNLSGSGEKDTESLVRKLR